MDTKAIDLYVRALRDIAHTLEQHQEARSVFDSQFLFRIIRDGFLQTISEYETGRILRHSKPNEEFLLWQGPVCEQKMNWNCIGWIFPFSSDEEIEDAYEKITRAQLATKSWGKFRQFVLSCRLRVQETPFDIPSNLIKVRVMGAECRIAMRMLTKYPPNLRYVTKALLDQLPSSSYVRKRIRIKIVVGEKLTPYVHTLSEERPA